MVDTMKELRTLVDGAGLSRYADEILRLPLNTIGVEAESIPGGTLPVGTSRIGGVPDLPPDWQWPYYEHEPRETVRYHHSTREPLEQKPYTISPLSFIAQMNMADIRDHDVDGVLPDFGMLYFFYDAVDQPWDAGAKVLYYDGDMSLLHQAAPPEDLCYYGRFPVGGLRFTHYPSVPYCSLPGDSVHIEKLGMTVPEQEELMVVFEKANSIWFPEDSHAGEGPGHRMLGYPVGIQGDPFADCENRASPGVRQYCQDVVTHDDILAGLRMNPEFVAGAVDWRLLFQVDSVSRSGGDDGMMWGDVGLIYFCIRAQDLTASDFSQISLTLQCS